MQHDLESILAKCLDSIRKVTNEEELERVRLHYLGKKGLFRELVADLPSMSVEQRSSYGSSINKIKTVFCEELAQQQHNFETAKFAEQLTSEAVDVTLPGTDNRSGRLHPLSITRRRVEDIFRSLGYTVFEGPEIEDEYHNFEALNIPQLHPARAMHDTFYLQQTFANGLRLLRTHTSPVQIRTMESNPPPIRAITMGRVYRCDSDITHTPMFHQMECLLIDVNVNFANLKATLATFVRSFFEKEVQVRFRPSYFPFTEPSAEVDIGCVHCDGAGCRVCSNTGWLEILGSGLVHPKVLEAVGVDTKTYSGFAFGLGLERLTMLKYQVDDLRLFFENDMDFLKQFR